MIPMPLRESAPDARHPSGIFSILPVFVPGIPPLAAADRADQHRYLSLLPEVLLLWSGAPAGLVACRLFLSNGRYAVSTAAPRRGK